MPIFVYFYSYRARPELVEGYLRALEDILFNPIFTSFQLGTHWKELEMGQADERRKNIPGVYSYISSSPCQALAVNENA